MALKGLVPEFYCSDFARSLEFYTKALGFRVMYQRPEDKFAYLEREGTEIMIEAADVGRKWLAGELSQPFGRGVSFQIACRDAQALHDAARNAGHKIFLAMEDKWYRKDDVYVGNRQFIVQDPDGFLLRFAQDLGSRAVNEVAHV